MSKKDEMTPIRYAVILAMADCNLNICAAARKLEVDHASVYYHIKRIISITGKDPRKFYGLANDAASQLLYTATEMIDEAVEAMTEDGK